MSTMGERIKQCRLEKDLTMEELAEKVDVKKSAVNKWEKGLVQNLKRSTILKLAKLFEVSPNWLMGWEPVTTAVQSDQEILNRLRFDNDITPRQKFLIQRYEEADERTRGAIDVMLGMNEFQNEQN